MRDVLKFDIRHISYILPTSVLYERYYKNNIVGPIFTEILPYLVTAAISNVSLINPMMGIFALYSFYEIGYIWNDVISIKKEECPKIRLGFNDYNVTRFAIIRIIVTIFAIYVTCNHSSSSFTSSILLAAFILFVFYAHNELMRGEWRVCTFIILNVLKVFFIYFVSGLDLVVMLGFAPFWVVKLIDYLLAKKIVIMNYCKIDNLFCPVFVAFIVTLMFFSVGSVFVCLVFGLLYNRKLLLKLFPKAWRNNF